MKLIRAYVNCIKKNGLWHALFTCGAAAAVTVRILWLLLGFISVNAFELAVYFLIPFLCMALFWLAALSPVRSPLWLYRVIGIYIFVSKGYNASVKYACTEGFDAPHRLGKWLWIWFKPLLICGGILIAHRLLSYLAKKGIKPFVLYRSVLATVQPFFKAQKSDKPLSIGKRILLVLGCVLMCLSAVMVAATTFLHLHFPSMDFEAILFTVQYANDGYTPAMGRKLVLYAFIALLLAAVLCERLVRMVRSNSLSFKSPVGGAKTSSGAKSTRIAACVIVPVFSVSALCSETGTFEYIKNRLHTSTLYEDYYVKPTDDIISFPEKKKNLIYIYLESYENSYTTPENGGLQSKDLMPELAQIARENISFSHGEELGGSTVYAPSIAYTMGATVAQTSGVVLMTPLGKMRNKMGELQSFLPSLRRLEDVLHDNGYEQLFIEGSDSNFAAYNSYVGRYEDSNIFDLNSARDEGLIPKDYFEMWGFEDSKMFEFSKLKIDALAKSDKPFAVTMYTMDTHSFEEGYRCELCDKSIKNRFASAVRCTSKQMYDFLEWLKTKPYYDDTVVVITGDHIAEHFPTGIEFEEEGYTRTPFNCFINSAKEPVKEKERLFAPMDMFPTTLSAMGAEIKGDRLGLGTDLFSETKTLAEEIGVKELSTRIQQSSDYFNKEFWKA